MKFSKCDYLQANKSLFLVEGRREYLQGDSFYNNSQARTMKTKENGRRKKSQQRNSSLSIERPSRKSNFSSMVFESGRNSLCSPRQPPTDKYHNYMNYITTVKFFEAAPKPNQQQMPSRHTSITPTPKRISASLIEHGRRSVTGKENTLRGERNRSFSRQDAATPKGKSKPLFVKGSNIVKVQQQPKKAQIKRKNKEKVDTKDGKESRPVSASKKGKGEKKRGKKEDKEELEQKRMLQKLFKDIQFYRDLGKGAHALVKSGVDWKTKRKIAIKIYQKNELKQDELRSIKREVEILGSLDHPNIIKLYQIFQSHKTINLIMEYGGGNSVDQYLRNKKKGYLEEPEAKDIFREVLEGVAYMHERGVAHRDIKPQNILLNKYLKVKIIDFGFGIKSDPQSTINQYCGTPTYMPPEVVTKVPHSPFLADRWSLGILLYTMLNGHCPFKAHNQKQLFGKICDGEYGFEPFVSELAVELVSLFLKKEPGERVSARSALSHPWLGK